MATVPQRANNRTPDDEAAIAADLAQARRSEESVFDSKTPANDNALPANAFDNDVPANDNAVAAPRSGSAAADYLNELNRTPRAANVPLVANDNAAPVGLSAAYQGPTFQGEGDPLFFPTPIDGGDGGLDADEDEQDEESGSGRSFDEDGEDDDEDEMMVQTTGPSPENFLPALQEVEQRLQDAQEAGERISKQRDSYYNRTVKPLKRAMLRSVAIDTARALRNYTGLAVPTWWWTIIGAIIDILAVFPIIIILYFSGAAKGKFTRTTLKDYRFAQNRLKQFEKNKARAEEEVIALEQERAVLMEQIMMLQQQQQQQQQLPPS